MLLGRLRLLENSVRDAMGFGLKGLGLGFRVWVWGLGFGVWGLGFRV